MYCHIHLENLFRLNFLAYSKINLFLDLHLWLFFDFGKLAENERKISHSLWIDLLSTFIKFWSFQIRFTTRWIGNSGQKMALRALCVVIGSVDIYEVKRSQRHLLATLLKKLIWRLCNNACTKNWPSFNNTWEKSTFFASPQAFIYLKFLSYWKISSHTCRIFLKWVTWMLIIVHLSEI